MKNDIKKDKTFKLTQPTGTVNQKIPKDKRILKI